jgi:hypothetical protein
MNVLMKKYLDSAGCIVYLLVLFIWVKMCAATSPLFVNWRNKSNDMLMCIIFSDCR